MQTRGLSLGLLNDDEYLAAVSVDDSIAQPLYKAQVQIYDAEIAASELGVDNLMQREYIKSQVESLKTGLDAIIKYLEG